MKLTVRVEPFEQSMNRSLETAKKLTRGEKVKPSRAFNLDPQITPEELFRVLDEDRRGHNWLGLSAEDIEQILREVTAKKNRRNTKR